MISHCWKPKRVLSFQIFILLGSKDKHWEDGSEVEEGVTAYQWLGQGAWRLGSPAVLGFRESAWPASLTECMGWGGSKACLLFSVSVSKYSNSFLKFYILVEWGHVPMNMFNVQNDFWDVCKPPTVLLPRQGGPRAVGIYVPGATNAWAGPGLLFTLHLCLRSSHPVARKPGRGSTRLWEVLPQQHSHSFCAVATR